MIFILLTFFFLTQTRFPYSHKEFNKTIHIEMPIQLIDGKSYVQFPIENTNKAVKHPTTNISNIECIHYSSFIESAWKYIKNPSKQKYNYDCTQALQKLVIRTSNLDLIVIPVFILAGKTSGNGVLGLSKNSNIFQILPKTKKMFAIWSLQNNGISEGKISFGGYNPLLISGEIITIFSSERDSKWKIWMQGFRIGQQNMQGISSLGFPNAYFNKFLNLLPENLNCRQNNGIQCSCQNFISGQFPILTFKLANAQFIMLPEQYIQIIDFTCHVMITNTQQEQFIIGSSFFKNHIVVFNQNSIQIGNLATPVIQSKVTLSNILSLMTILLISVFATIIVVEIVRRSSGLATVKQQTIHEIIIREGELI